MRTFKRILFVFAIAGVAALVFSFSLVASMYAFGPTWQIPGIVVVLSSGSFIIWFLWMMSDYHIEY